MTTPLVLFVAPSRSSLGELHNAVTAALSASRSIDFEFFVTSVYFDYVAGAGLRAIRLRRGPDGVADVLSYVEKRRPDHVIIADHHLFNLEQMGTSLADFESIWDGMSTFDSLAFAPQGVELRSAFANLKGAERIERLLPSTVVIDPLPDRIRAIRPVPVANGPIGDSFALYPEPPVPKARPSETRERLDIPADARVVVFARSKWAKQAYALLSMLSRNRGTGSSPSDAMVNWIHEAFSRLDAPVVVFGLGANKSTPTNPNVSFRELPFLGLADFDNLLGATDLYITDNLVSAAMARAARMGVPCLAMTNVRGHKSADSFSDAWHSRMAIETPGYDFKFLINPFGWAEELAHLTRENPYLESVPRAEIFDMDDLSSAIATELGSPSPVASLALESSNSGLQTFEDFAHTLIHQ